MLQLIKRDYLINQMYFVIILMAIPAIYIFDISPLFMYMFIMFGVLFNVFYYDDHNHVYRAVFGK